MFPSSTNARHLRSIHIVLCTDGVFPFAMGGMQRHSRLLAEELAKRPGIALTVIHPHGRQIFDPELRIAEVFVPPIDMKAFYFRELWRYSGRVADQLDRLRPDVIISQGFSVWKGIDRFSRKLIVHPHGLEMFQAMGVKERLVSIPFQLALRAIMRNARYVISLGGLLTSIIEKQLKGSSATIAVIPNAVDVPSGITEYPEGNGLQLFFAGRFAVNKGIDVLMEVADRLLKRPVPLPVRFILAGDGPLLPVYEAKGIPRNVELLGRIDDPELFRMYSECHALILPTRFEGMPTVVLEAMARARPIFVSNVGATAELVDEGNGSLLPKGDAEALYRAIESFASLSAAKRKEMGLRSYEKARSKYRWPVVADRFVDLARSITG